MSQFSLFSSGQELANLVVSSDLLHHSWLTISDLNSQTYLNNPTNPFPIVLKVYPYNSNGAIVAFVSSPTYTLQKEMVASEDLKGSQSPFDFISTKLNPHFSVNKAAITLFALLLNELSALKEKLSSSSPLIITGLSLGGSVASLFTLWLLDNISPEDNNKRPTCITFGSPLLGDHGLQQAISERPSWHSSFLNIVSNQDPIPRFLISPTNAFAGSIPQSCIYKPFGTFLLCSDSDCSCLEEPESVLDLMTVMNSNSQHQDNRFLPSDYEQVLERLKHSFKVNQLKADISLQLEAMGIGGQHTSNMSSLRNNMEKRVEASFLKKSNEGGYYDAFKCSESLSRDAVKCRQETVMCQRILTKYRKIMDAEIEKMTQEEVNLGRSEHYKQLEKCVKVDELSGSANKRGLTKCWRQLEKELFSNP